MAGQRDDPEHRLSHWIDRLLDHVLLPPAWYTAQDHSGRAIFGSPQAQINWRAKQKWYGVKPSQLDWRVIQREPNIYAEIELKHGTNTPDTGQQTTMRLLSEQGFVTGCAWSVVEFYNILRNAGFRLHPDAEAITAEIAAKHSAAELASGAKSGTKRRSARPPSRKPTPAQVRRAERLRAQTLF